MSLRQVLINIFTKEHTLDFDGFSHAGSFNVESGIAEFKSRHFSNCDACESMDGVFATCRSCGRTKGNNLRFLAGRGDGVYAGITGYAESRHAFTMYVFDEDNSMASTFSKQLDGVTLRGMNVQSIFIDAVKDFMDLPAAKLGDIETTFSLADLSSVGFVIGDVASAGSGFATVDHGFANGAHSVYLFGEPILASSVVQLSLRLGQDPEIYDGGYTDAIRPRVALIVDGRFEQKLLKGVSFDKPNWEKQAAVWSKTHVMANVAGGNAEIGNYFNGLFWLAAQKDQDKLAQQSDVGEAMSFYYQNKAIGYFFAGALLGDEDCKACVEDIIALDEPGTFLDPEVLRGILGPRGIPVDAKALEMVKELS